MIELRTLGTLDLRRRNGLELLSVLSQPKRAALLCYLALARPRGFQRRDTLLPLFWPDADAEHARASLRQAIHRLRAALGEDVILSRGDEDLGIAADALWCDGVAFEQALDAGDAERALALYGGELLRGLFVQDAPEFERWLEAERTRLHERAVRGAWSLAETHERAGDAAGAARWGRRALELAPADEALLRGYMEMVARSGHPGRAEEAYRSYARRLREEYELAPTAEMSALADQIRARKPRARAPGHAGSHGHAAAPGTAAVGAGLPRFPGHGPAAAGGNGRGAAVDPPGLSVPTSALPPHPRAPARRASAASASPARIVRGVPAFLRRHRWVATVSGMAALSLVAFGVRAWHLRRSAVSLEQRSIAVLPLVDVSPGRDQDSFADAVTAGLIDELGRIPGLRVPGRTSSFYFKGRTRSLPLKEIARRLRVAYVLEGSVLREGSRVHAVVQLTRAANERQLWNQSYGLANADIVASQREIARYIAGTFALRATDIPSRLPARLEAYDLYLQGLFAWRNAPFDLTTVSSQQAAAVDLFRKAVAIDPGFAHAWAGLAEAHYQADDFRQARVEALRALALDSTLALAHHALAGTLAYGEWKWAEAERALERGIRLAPSSAHLVMARAELRWVLGRKQDAYMDYQRALTLDPLLSDFKLAWADALTRVGWYRQAFEVLDSIPGPQPRARLVRRQAAVAAGLREQALALARAEGDNEILTLLRGDRRDVIALVNGAPNPCHAAFLLWLYSFDQQNRLRAPVAGEPPVTGTDLREVASVRNERHLACLEWGVRMHGSWVVFSLRTHRSDSLRSEPRYQALLRKVGLPD